MHLVGFIIRKITHVNIASYRFEGNASVIQATCTAKNVK